MKTCPVLLNSYLIHLLPQHFHKLREDLQRAHGSRECWESKPEKQTFLDMRLLSVQAA